MAFIYKHLKNKQANSQANQQTIKQTISKQTHTVRQSTQQTIDNAYIQTQTVTPSQTHTHTVTVTRARVGQQPANQPINQSSKHTERSVIVRVGAVLFRFPGSGDGGRAGCGAGGRAVVGRATSQQAHRLLQ